MNIVQRIPFFKRLLNIRKFEEQKMSIQLSECEKKIQNLKKLIMNYNDERNNLLDEFTNKLKENIDFKNINKYYYLLKNNESSHENLTKRKNQTEEQKEIIRQKTLDAMKERKKVEKLIELAEKNEYKILRDKEHKYINEINMNYFYRKESNY